VNPHNFCPVFTHEQIAASLQATIFTTLTLYAATILDQNQLHSNILAALPSDSSISDYLLHLEGHWSKDDIEFLRLYNRIYILDHANLRLQVLYYHHDHILAGHLGRNKILELIWRHYTWPNIHNNIQKFCNSCVTCMRSKPVSQTIQIPSTTSYPRASIEFNFYGLHRETPFLLWFQHHPSYSGSTVKTSHIHPHS